MGYVGLPVAVAFSARRKVLGYDLSSKRIAQLKSGFDVTGEVEQSALTDTSQMVFTSTVEDLSLCSIFIVCVPTPIDSQNIPDLEPLVKASTDVGHSLSKGALVIFESTVYPGVTEETCIPILEEVSGLKVNKDFFVGYSPERINPGDQSRRFESISKVVSGSSNEALEMVASLYSEVIQAPIHKAPSIKVAEAAKVIENTQRDLNIALINELSKIFDLLDIDTHEVLRAANTKWNFMPFSPGLVGGHCIGVDPYYLTHKAQQVGYVPKVILAGREINDSMGKYVAQRVRHLVFKNPSKATTCWSVLVLGATFKENCPDLRNSRVFDLVQELVSSGATVSISDPWVEQDQMPLAAEVEWIDWERLSVDIVKLDSLFNFDAVVLAVSHDQFVSAAPSIRSLLSDQGILFDVKGALPTELVDDRL